VGSATRERWGRLRGHAARAVDRVFGNAPDLILGDGLASLAEDGGEQFEQDGSGPRGRRRRTRWRASRTTSGPLVIEPRQAGVLARVPEWWRYRRLTTYFGRLQLEKLYRRTVLGWLWIPLRPVISIASRVLVFGGLLGTPSGGIPYLLFFLVGLTAWQLFAYTLFWATRSIELGRRVLRRMYVPRITCLFGSLVPSGVNFLLYVAITGIVVTFFVVTEGQTHLIIGSETALLPIALLLVIALALAIGTITSVLAAYARDVRFIIGYVLAFWFFLTPVLYPLSEVPSGFRDVASINPMTAPIEMVRIALFSSGTVTQEALASCVGAILLIGIPGLWFFNRAEALSLDSL
jgi:lipopolysaccharide transport system permease protein